MPTVTLTNPDETAFDAAYLKLTGKGVIPGRSSKVINITRRSWDGVTVFGTCEVAWMGGFNNKRVVISTADATMRLQFAPVRDEKPEPTAVLVSENVGGIFAYLHDYDKAVALANALNRSEGVDPAQEEKTYYVLDFDDNHRDDFAAALRNEELVDIVEGDDRIGYAIVENPETIKLLVA